MVLSPSDPAGLNALLSNLYNPSSPEYHQWLAPGQFDQDFGPSTSTLDATLAWLRGLGFQATAGAGFAIDASGSASAVGAGLGVSLDRYRLSGGEAVFAESETPQVPASLAPDIADIIGLNDLPAATPNSLQAASATLSRPGLATAAPAAGAEIPQAFSACSGAANAASANGGYTPVSLGTAYGVSSLLNAGFDGSGERLGVYELAPSTSSDVSGFESCFGLHDPLSTVEVDDGGTPSTAGTEEADLDIEQLAAQVPGATSITSYEGPNDTIGAYDTAVAMVSADTAKFISDGWGLCEALNTTSGLGSISSMDVLLEQAATQGQAIFTAAGDCGSEDCFRADGDTSLGRRLPVLQPLGDRGRRHLAVAQRERDGLERLPGGRRRRVRGQRIRGRRGRDLGVEGRPLWQNGLTEPARASCGSNGTNCRMVPDVSADAGVPVTFLRRAAGACYVGTSLGAPMVAGIWADRASGARDRDRGRGAGALSWPPLARRGRVNDITSGNNDFTGTNGGALPGRPRLRPGQRARLGHRAAGWPAPRCGRCRPARVRPAPS